MRVLMRGYADPFEPLDPLSAMMDRRIGQNTGNLIFTASVMRNLLTPSTEMVGTYETSLATAAINDSFDHFVLPLANAFRPEFIDRLEWFSTFIEKLTIPVTVLGVGAQTTLDDDWSRIDALAPQVTRFVRAVLDHGPSIGVRGESTRAYLQRLGFSDVVTIGCPSMYYTGGELTADRRVERLTRTSSVSINLTPRLPLPKGFVTEHVRRFPRTTYVAQDHADLRVMLGGAPITGAGEYPSTLFHPLLRDDKTQLFLNAQVWIDHMRSHDFAFGTRIHGNVAAILAGVPAHVIVHDSRTRELAEHFEIPHTAVDDLAADVTAADLFDRSDWSAMVENHPARYRHFCDFLDQHGLDHVGRHPGVEPPFDVRTRSAELGSGSVVTVRGTEPALLSARELRSTMSAQRRLDELEAEVARLSREIARRPVSLGARITQRLRRRR